MSCGGGWPRLLSGHQLGAPEGEFCRMVTPPTPLVLYLRGGGHFRSFGTGAYGGLPVATDSASDSSFGAPLSTLVHRGSLSGGRVGSHWASSLLWGQRVALFLHP